MEDAIPPTANAVGFFAEFSMNIDLPPIKHRCCGTPCFYEYNNEKLPCWGDIICIDYEIIGDDEYRTGACEEHIDMYPSYNKIKYNKYEKQNV